MAAQWRNGGAKITRPAMNLMLRDAGILYAGRCARNCPGSEGATLEIAKPRCGGGACIPAMMPEESWGVAAPSSLTSPRLSSPFAGRARGASECRRAGLPTGADRMSEEASSRGADYDRGYQICMNALERAGDRWAVHRFRVMSRKLRDRLSDSDFESPIEASLGLALLAEFAVFSGLHIDYWPGWKVCPDDDEAADNCVLISPQALVGKYRVDILLVAKYRGIGPKYVAVECDGHDFHEKTRAQASRDKSRDRFIQSKGLPVFRFTGSEIWRDANGCAREVYDFLLRSFQKTSE